MGLGGGGDGDGGNWEGETVMGQRGGRDRDGEMGKDRSSQGLERCKGLESLPRKKA